MMPTTLYCFVTVSVSVSASCSYAMFSHMTLSVLESYRFPISSVISSPTFMSIRPFVLKCLGMTISSSFFAMRPSISLKQPLSKPASSVAMTYAYGLSSFLQPSSFAKPIPIVSNVLSIFLLFLNSESSDIFTPENFT